MEQNKDIVTIPFVAHESSMNRLERANKRLFIIIIVLIICFFVYLLIPSDFSDNSQEASADNGSKVEQKIEE